MDGGETESGKEKVRRAPRTIQHFYRAFLWSRLRDLSWLNIFPSHLIQLWWTEFSLENVDGCMTMGWLWGNPSRPPTVTTVFSKEMEFGGNVVIGTFWWPLKCFIPNNGFSVSVLYLNMDIFAQPQRGQSVSTNGLARGEGWLFSISRIKLFRNAKEQRGGCSMTAWSWSGVNILFNWFAQCTSPMLSTLSKLLQHFPSRITRFYLKGIHMWNWTLGFCILAWGGFAPLSGLHCTPCVDMRLKQGIQSFFNLLHLQCWQCW